MAQTSQAPDGTDWVRPQVAEAWRRCIDDYGLSPRISLLRPEFQSDPEDNGRAVPTTRLDVRTALDSIAFSLQPMLKDASVSLLLADARGELIHVMDAGMSLGPMGRRLVRLGQSWNERVIGNNGLGTAATVLEPAAFEGKEHFSPELHPFATVGHPLLSPDGALVAVLGLVTDQRSSGQALLALVRIASHLIEASLFQRQAPGVLTLRLRPSPIGATAAGRDCLFDGLVSLDPQGRIVGATRSALDMLRSERLPDLLRRPIEAVLGVTIAGLRASARDGEALDVDAPSGRCLTVELGAASCVGPREEARPSGRACVREPAIRPSARPACLATPQEGQAECWRDGVLDAALQKAIRLQNQKSPILITGESGVGKDYLVRMIHANGPRKGRPLVLVNCAAIPRELISSELFGYAAGSFTGAHKSGKAGKFLEAHTGVLFLDEIGDMALDLQAALLCALDHSEIVPVGGAKPVAVDVQIVAATNSQLLNCVRNGTFRRDLYYRINGAQLWLPPLRERSDKLGLIQNLWTEETKAQGLAERKALSAEVWDIFDRHPWPGNIRELRNVLRTCLAMTRGSVIRVMDLPNDFLEEMSFFLQSGASEGDLPDLVSSRPSIDAKPLANWEADAIRSALATTDGNISQAARELGITRATLYHKMARHGLRKERPEQESSKPECGRNG